MTFLQGGFVSWKNGLNNTPGTSRIDLPSNAILVSETSVRHTASGISWRLFPGSFAQFRSWIPFLLPLGRFACNANAQVNASAYIKYSDAGIYVSCLMIKGNTLSGITADQISSNKTDDTNWEQLTVTCQPTEAGVIELFLSCYGTGATPTGKYIYIDDVSVTQA